MRIWIQLCTGIVEQFDVEDLADAQALARDLHASDWDIFSFREPPVDPEPITEFKYIPF